MAGAWQSHSSTLARGLAEFRRALSPSRLHAHRHPCTHKRPLACAGLVGDGFTYLLDLARKRVVQPGATVVPAAATVYCVGVQALTGDVAGFDFSSFNKYR